MSVYRLLQKGAIAFLAAGMVLAGILPGMGQGTGGTGNGGTGTGGTGGTGTGGAAAALDPISGNATVLRYSNNYIMLIYGISGAPTAIPPYTVSSKGDTTFPGRWGIVTVGGDPTTSADDGLPVEAWSVCQYQVEPQLFATPTLQEQQQEVAPATGSPPWYRVGNATDGTYSQAPAVDPTTGTISSVWDTAGNVVTPTTTNTGNNNNNNNNNNQTTQLVGVQVQEKLQVVRDLVRAQYTFVNTSGYDRHIRVRLFHDPIERWQTLVDGSWVINRRHYEYESDFPGSLVPHDWRVYTPTLSAPTLIIHGILDQFDATRPDRFLVGSTGNGGGGPFNDVLWEYIANPSFRLDGAPGTNTDDGCWSYYETFTLRPGDTKSIVQYIGLGVAYEDPTPPYVLATQAPRTLGFVLGDDSSTATTESSYPKPRTFKIQAYLNNTSLFDINNASLYLTLPKEMTLTTTTSQSLVQSVGTVLQQGEGSASWEVQVDPAASGVLSYTVTASGVPVVSKTVTGYIEVPAGVSRSFNAGLQMVSVPFQFTNPDTQVALGWSADRIHLARWNPTSKGYAYFPDTYVSSLSAGQGYWFKPDLASTVNLVGATPVARGLQANFIMPVKAGWNMIGDPFVYPIPWANTKVSDGTQMLTLDDATRAGWVHPTVFSYNSLTRSYEFGSVSDQLLTPWVGYWLRVDQDCFLVFPPISTPEASIDAPNQRSAKESGWKIQLTARAGGASDLCNYFGVSRAASDGYSDSDIDEPPSPGQGYVSLRFLHNDWGKRSGTFTQDIRSDSFSGDKTWEFEVETDQVGQSVVLAWPSFNAKLPRGYSALLEDESTSRKVWMRSQGSYTYAASKNAGPRRFRLTVTRQSGAPLVISDVQMTSAGSRAAARSISFQSSGQAVADVRILSPNGRTIRQVATGQAVTAGRSEVVWDGTNAQGARITSGIVLVEVTATAPEGNTIRVVRPCVLTR